MQALLTLQHVRMAHTPPVLWAAAAAYALAGGWACWRAWGHKPGSSGGRAPPGSSRAPVRLTPSIVAHHLVPLALLAGCYCVRRADVDRLMCLGMLLARKLRRHDGAQMHANNAVPRAHHD
jgi:hypothetical protein